MPVSKVTVGSSISIQASKPVKIIPPIGELPTQRAKRRDVPVTPVQDDKLFIRESIGSATVEKRLDLDISDDGLALSACRNDSGVQIGLSIDRPVSLASIDVFSRFADDATIEKSIDENLRLAEFESDLLKADYDFLMNSLKLKNGQLLQDFQDSLSDEEAALEDKMRILSEISSKGEEVSRRLDFIRPENEFSSKIQEEANNLRVRFEESKTPSLNNSVHNQYYTSTSLIKKIEENINTNPLTDYETDLLGKVKRGSTLIDGFVTRDGVRYSYNLLSEFDKVISCCKALSKIMAETFTKAKFPNLKNVNLPVSLDGVGFRSNFVFESNDISGAENSAFNERFEDLLSSTRLAGSTALTSAIESVSLENFSPDKSIKNNNFDSIISRVSENGLSDASRLESLKNRYRDAKNFLKFKRAVGFDNDACSPHDLVFDAMSLVANSFPTYINGITDSVPNEYELLDALLMSFGCKRVGSDANLNALWRAIILSTVTDSSYIWGEADTEVYDSRTESRTTTDIDGEKKTTKSNSGVNVKGKGTVTSTTFDAYYDPLKKRGFIPSFADEWIRNFLQDAEIELSESEPQSHPLFNINYLREKKLLQTIDLGDNVLGDADGNGNPDSTAVELRIPTNANTFNFNDEVDSSLLLFNCVRSYSERSNVGSKVVDFYNKIVAKFSDNYGAQIDETSFTCDGRNVTKNEVYDLIFECLSNLVVAIVNPTLTPPVAVKTEKKQVSRSAQEEFRYEYIIDKRMCLLSSYKSEGEITVGPSSTAILGTPVLYNVYESFRLLNNLRSLSQSSSRGLLSSLVFSLDLGGSLLSKDAVGDPRDLPSSDYVTVSADVFSRLTQMVREYADDIFDLSAISCISSIVDLTITDIISLQKKSKNLKNSLTNFSENQKNDVFKCLSIVSSTSTLLKSIVRNIASSENFENSYEKDRTLLDISATRWFFSNHRFLDYEKSRLVFFGLPQCFTNALNRQAREVDPETFKIVGDPVPNTTPVYFESWLTSRGIQDSTQIYEYKLMRFHPLIHVVQKDKILRYDSFVTVSESRFGAGSTTSRSPSTSSLQPVKVGLYDRFSIYVFQPEAGVFGLPLSIYSVEFKNAVNKLGLSVEAAIEIVNSHILDSIYKSIARTLSGLQIDSDALGTHKRAMSVSDAESVLQLMDSDTAGIIPRGSMSAINFLNRNEDGFIESVPFSRLRGRSSDMTNPSDHALLMKFLNTRAFTKGTLSREVLLPSAFERVYCGIFNPADADLAGSPAENINISQITIKAIRL